MSFLLDKPKEFMFSNLNSFMKKISLQFPSIMLVIDFTLTIESNVCEMNKETLVVSGEFSAKEIELAISGYKAILV